MFLFLYNNNIDKYINRYYNYYKDINIYKGDYDYE